MAHLDRWLGADPYFNFNPAVTLTANRLYASTAGWFLSEQQGEANRPRTTAGIAQDENR